MTAQKQYWNSKEVKFSPSSLGEVARSFRRTTYVIRDQDSGAIGCCFEGDSSNVQCHDELLATLPPLYPEWLGDRRFTARHHLRYGYVAGAMANGIASEELVIAMVRAGFLAFFGSAGLSTQRVEKALDRLFATLPDQSWGANLIHSPNEPELESKIAQMYIERGVRRVSAAAYMKLTPYLLRYALHGLYRDENGVVRRTNHLFAKISRPEVARHFLNPAPEKMVGELVRKGWITHEEGLLAKEIPVAAQLTIEADSGGHTDNQSLSSLFPIISSLRDEAMLHYRYQEPIFLGAAGGLGSPRAVAGAFSLGASYVLTGSVNQACVESGLHKEGKKLLASVGIADVCMAPAADMFELGVEVQVVQRGTMFANRAKKLYHWYRSYSSLEELSPSDNKLLAQYLQTSVEEAWETTKAYWQRRDPQEIQRAQKEPKHKMALLFRSYLGQSSRWAIQGLSHRTLDYQIWCGPAMGAFNMWTKGTFLEAPEQRTVVQVALNMMEGAAVITRAQQLRTFGVLLPAHCFSYRPQKLPT